MRKISKIMGAIAGLVAMLGLTSIAVNNKVESDNRDRIQDIYKQKQKAEDELSDFVELNYTQKESYKRKEIINNKAFDISKLNSNFEFLTKREGYINTESYKLYSNYNNIKSNKNLTVYIHSNVSQTERSLIEQNVSYLNNIFHSINSELSIKVTQNKIDSNSCICIYNTSEAPRGFYGGTTLAETRAYEYGTSEYNGPINIYVYTSEISKLYGYNLEVYNEYYKSVLLHEITHALGIDHCLKAIEENCKNQNELCRPLMHTGIAQSNPKDFFSSSEIAELFAWINHEKYVSASINGTLNSELNSDFIKYIELINYSLNQSKIYNSYSTAPQTLKNNQVFQITYKDKENSNIDGKKLDATIKITFNYPCQNMYQKECVFEDGTKTSFVAPYFYSKDANGNGKYSLLSSNYKNFETANIYNQSTETYKFKEFLSFDELSKVIENFDIRNGYTIENGSTKFDEYTISTQNLWEKILGKSTENVIYVKAPTFSINYKYSWSIGNSLNNISAEETTNYLTEKEIQNIIVNQNETLERD